MKKRQTFLLYLFCFIIFGKAILIISFYEERLRWKRHLFIHHLIILWDLRRSLYLDENRLFALWFCFFIRISFVTSSELAAHHQRFKYKSIIIYRHMSNYLKILKESWSKKYYSSVTKICINHLNYFKFWM